MTTTLTTPGEFVPADLDASRWPNLEPLYRALLERELKCSGCLETLLLDRSELDAAAAEAQANLYIAMTCHTDDEAAKKAYLDFVEHVQPELKKAAFALDRRIVECPHAAELDAARYDVLLRGLRADVEIFREANIPLQTEDTRLDQQYSEMRGAMMVEFDGQEQTLPQMVRYLERTDRAERESAWRTVAERQQVDGDRTEDIFDRMIELRRDVARNTDLASYRDYAFRAMHRFDYGPEHCEAFHRAAEEVCVPVMRRLNAERAASLGVDTLRPWDLAVDVQGREPLRPFKDPDDLVERSSRLFHRMDGELGSLFDSMRTADALDLESRKGKAPGGYQYQRDRSRTTFIFMNAAGLQRDLETMIHESGHAFHSMLSRHDPLVTYRHAPIEFAEVASMSMELLALPYLDEFYGEADANRARRGQLESVARLLPWIATIDAFQHWLYTHPTHDRAERERTWLDLERRFGPDVDWSGLEDFRRRSWQRQLHLFGVPFYYIEYGIAQLGALQIWLQSLEDEGRAIASYRKAMTLGGSRPLPGLFAAADLDFDFGPETMARLMNAVGRELGKLPE